MGNLGWWLLKSVALRMQRQKGLVSAWHTLFLNKSKVEDQNITLPFDLL
jgi:hypothetical protein